MCVFMSIQGVSSLYHTCLVFSALMSLEAAVMRIGCINSANSMTSLDILISGIAVSLADNDRFIYFSLVCKHKLVGRLKAKDQINSKH